MSLIDGNQIQINPTEQSHVGHFLVQVKACLKSNPDYCMLGSESMIAVYPHKTIDWLHTKTFPALEDFKAIPLDNFRLSKFKYKILPFDSYEDSSGLGGVQLVFANGAESPLFENPLSINNSLFTFTFNPEDEIRSVSMKMKGNNIYTGIRFFNQYDEAIFANDWSELNEWTPQQYIPADQRIIGMKYRSQSEDANLFYLSFLLGEKEKHGIVGELFFPE